MSHNVDLLGAEESNVGVTFFESPNDARHKTRYLFRQDLTLLRLQSNYFFNELNSIDCSSISFLSFPYMVKKENIIMIIFYLKNILIILFFYF